MKDVRMDCAGASAWVDQYVRAWNSNDPADIGALFAEDGIYRTGPFDEPWIGRDNIVRNWLARPDAPGSTSFRYEVLATTSDAAIIRGWTIYRDPPGEFSNIWLIQFDNHGRCRGYTEWWIERLST